MQESRQLCAATVNVSTLAIYPDISSYSEAIFDANATLLFHPEYAKQYREGSELSTGASAHPPQPIRGHHDIICTGKWE